MEKGNIYFGGRQYVKFGILYQKARLLVTTSIKKFKEIKKGKKKERKKEKVRVWAGGA